MCFWVLCFYNVCWRDCGVNLIEFFLKEMRGVVCDLFCKFICLFFFVLYVMFLVKVIVKFDFFFVVFKEKIIKKESLLLVLCNVFLIFFF